MSTEHDLIKSILTTSVDQSLGEISPMARDYANPYVDWLVERAMYALDQHGYAIARRPAHAPPPTAPAPPTPTVVSAAGTATGSSKL